MLVPHKLYLVLTNLLHPSDFSIFCRTKVVNARLLDMASRPTSAVIVELHLDENTLHPSLSSHSPSPPIPHACVFLYYCNIKIQHSNLFIFIFYLAFDFQRS